MPDNDKTARDYLAEFRGVLKDSQSNKTTDILKAQTNTNMTRPVQFTENRTRSIHATRADKNTNKDGSSDLGS